MFVLSQGVAGVYPGLGVTGWEAGYNLNTLESTINPSPCGATVFYVINFLWWADISYLLGKSFHNKKSKEEVGETTINLLSI